MQIKSESVRNHGSTASSRIIYQIPFAIKSVLVIRNVSFRAS